ncbi:MAG: decaprenyl-phosphate phosphoribosyltransferase [Sedimentisphaerales bacterium]|nr:decaprenyl-phosphate phosphoribosyltransferase [Sedimentisphaerales bacterium]
MKDATNKLGAYLAVMRPAHWVKNAFVLAPLFFSRQFRQPESCLRELIAAACFCLIASAVYIFNDLFDRREDSQHPVKRHRPIAAGSVPPVQAWVLLTCLAVVGVAGSVYLQMRFLLIVLVYLGLNVLYSLGVKHIAILDVMILSAGFVLRILAGSVAIRVQPSHWLILCTIMISLFLGFTKRRTELVAVERQAQTTRKVLQHYSVRFLDQAIAMVTGATIVCYALYTVDDHTLAVLGRPAGGFSAMLITVPSVVYGLFRYIYLIYHDQESADPTTLLCRDVPTLINLLLWVALCYVAVSYGSRFDPFG